jgi:three-Cys-motif partner protein
MAVPTEVVMVRDPHTEAKHRILGSYLSAYFPIMSRQFSSDGVCFVDAFAGSGEYTDGGKGSPLIALGAASRPDVIDTGCSLDFVFIEEHQGRAEHLEKLLSKQSSCFRVRTQQGRCEDLLEPTLEELGLWSRAMFVNLDGWGVDTPYALVERIGKSKRAEVLVTFGPQWFTRFADQGEIGAGDRVFGDDRWRAVSEQPTETKRRFLVDQYRSRLAECGFEFQLTFELTDEGGHSLFLVFGTSSIYGVRKMKDAMWSVDSAAGSKFRDPRDPNQLSFGLSDDSPDLRLLKAQILERLSDGNRVSLEALKDFSLRETVYKETHAVSAVRELKAAMKIETKPARSHEDSLVWLAPPSLFDLS